METTETVVKMLESLPETAREIVLDRLRDMIEEMRDDAEWNELFNRKKEGLVTAARKAREEIAKGKSEPMDFTKL
jgi:hypothetical protein